MTKTAKLSKAQRSNLVRIWTERCAYGLKATDRQMVTLIDARVCTLTGFARMNRNASSSLVSKGLARVLTTTVEYSNDYADFRVQVLVLTDKGREAIGV